MSKSKKTTNMTSDPVIESEVLETESVGESSPEKIRGVVFDCVQLRVRNAPSLDGEVKTTIFGGTNLEVDLDKSTEEFYSVKLPEDNPSAASLNDKDLFCMRKFVKLVESGR